MTANELESMLRGPEADARSVPCQVELLYYSLPAICEANVYPANGLFCIGAGGSAGGPGKSRDGNANGGAGACADAFCQFAACFFADGSLAVDRFLGDSGKESLKLRGIDNRAADEGARAVGYGGQALCQKAAGAAFGGGEGKVSHAEHQQH